MGAALPIIAMVGSGVMSGMAQRQQAKAAAAQAEANARISEENAKRQETMAKAQDENNKINEENARRQRQLALGRQSAQIGASGITATGSALNALSDSWTAMQQEGAIQGYNNRQQVDSMLYKANDFDNQSSMYTAQAANYNKVASRAIPMSIASSLLQGVAMSSSLYSANSAATKAAGTTYDTSTINMTSAAGYSKNGLSSSVGWSKTF